MVNDGIYCFHKIEFLVVNDLFFYQSPPEAEFGTSPEVGFGTSPEAEFGTSFLQKGE